MLRSGAEPESMGSAQGLLKFSLENGLTPWLDQVWKDKIAAGFTNSGSRPGDKLLVLEQMAVFAAQKSMVWVGVGDHPGGNYSASPFTDVNVNGSWLGLMTQSCAGGTPETAPHPGDLLTAERFGRRIARTTTGWMMGADAFLPPGSVKVNRGGEISPVRKSGRSLGTKQLVNNPKGQQLRSLLTRYDRYL
jgi:NAD(P)H dehydrogenase (quinone)